MISGARDPSPSLAGVGVPPGVPQAHTAGLTGPGLLGSVRRGTACVWLRESDAYAPDHFRDGFRRLGYRIASNGTVPQGAADVLLVWNRRQGEEHAIRSAEARGARVLVAENGYLGKDDKGAKLFALAFDHHSGVGRWPVGDGSRWARLGLELAPWRTGGDHIVVLAQRCIGERGVAMPEGWAECAAAELARTTRRRVVIRYHPGVARTDPYDDLRGAWAAVTWGSGAGLKALLAGVPVFHGLASWIGAGASAPWPGDIEEPFLGDRLPTLERLAWGQWTRTEIESGEALSCLGL